MRAVARQPHITAEAAAEIIRAEIGAISLQSVYDALGVLVAEGLLRRIQPAGSPALYEDRVGDNHHHLICRICKRVVDIDCAVGAAPCLTPRKGTGYEIDEAEVAYWGRCPDCLTRSQPPTGGDSKTRPAPAEVRPQRRRVDAVTPSQRSSPRLTPGLHARHTREVTSHG